MTSAIGSSSTSNSTISSSDAAATAPGGNASSSSSSGTKDPLSSSPSYSLSSSSSSPLAQALANYCNSTEDDENETNNNAITHLNTILLHVQKTKKFEELVAQMGPYLTSEEAKTRTKATNLLGEVLNRLPTLPLTDAAVHHYVDFFTSRLSDFPSVAGTLLALRALLQYHGEGTRKEADVIAKALFKDVHVPSMTQNIRQRAFEVLFEMMGGIEEIVHATSASSSSSSSTSTSTTSTPPPSLLAMQDAFFQGLIDCVEGEKDPRCLILCLKILSRTQAAFPHAADEHAEALFDVTACYFPITFTPPPNDPYGITPEMLSQALRSALTVRPAMAEFVLPLLVDKLTSTHVPAKIEALVTLQLATRRYGLVAMRRNLPSIIAALFEEVVSCPEAVVVAQALETSRVLAAHLSNYTIVTPTSTTTTTTQTQTQQQQQKEAAADWQSFLRNFVHKSTAECKSNPDSLMGRACARLLGAVARASARAYAATLKVAVPMALQLLAGSPRKPPQEEDSGKKQAALELLVDLIDAVDPRLDFSVASEGPPLAPYVAQLHEALLGCLTAPEPGPALLAVKGLSSLATRSPSELLKPEQASALVTLFTTRLQAEERTIGPAYDPDLAQALLEGIHTLSKRRPEHTTAVLTHTLPELLGWMDEAVGKKMAGVSVGGGGGGGVIDGGEGGGGGGSSPELDRCLRALASLAEQPEVFQTVVPSLLNRVLLPPSTSSTSSSSSEWHVLKPGQGSVYILSSLAKIFVTTSAANRAALPALLALPLPPQPTAVGKENGGDAEGDAMEVEEGGKKHQSSSPCLWYLLTAILASGSAAGGGEGGGGGGQQQLEDQALEAALRVFAAATEALPPALQDLLARRLLAFFFPPSSSSFSFGGGEGEEDVSSAAAPPPGPTTIPALVLSDPAFSYPTQAQPLALLLRVLASLNVSSPLFASSGIKEGLFPALVRLALDAPPITHTHTHTQTHTQTQTLPEPACWGVALLANKAADESVVGEAVTQLLTGLKPRLLLVDEKNENDNENVGGGAAAAAGAAGGNNNRDVTTLIWLTKALAMRCTPKKSMEEAVSLLIEVVSGGAADTHTHTNTHTHTTPAQVTLALQAAEGFGLILRDSVPSPQTKTPTTTTITPPPPTAANAILAPRPTSARVNPLWRQRLFYLSFARLRQGVERHRTHPQAKAAVLLAVCNMVGGLPKPVIQSELEPILLVVIQGMSSTSNAALCARATETFAALVKDSVEAVVPHLATVIPLLYGLCTPSDPHFLPKANLRVLALQSLLELTRLPYAKLHPYRAQVSRGLLAPLDDKKRVVRQTAVIVRNTWMVLDR